MEPSSWWILGLAAVIAALVVAVVVLARRPREQDVEPVQPVIAPARPADPRRARPVQLAGPPMIDGDTLRDWLVHHVKREGVWAEVVAEFYSRAAAVPAVADYFRNTDMSRLQLHFTRALVIVTHTGVTENMIANVSQRHTTVRSSAGTPITGKVYDQVIGTLVDVLRAYEVPSRGITALADTVAPFRAALVGA